MINQLIGGDVSKCSGSAAAVRGLPWQADVQSWQLSQELHLLQRQLQVHLHHQVGVGDISMKNYRKPINRYF